MTRIKIIYRYLIRFVFCTLILYSCSFGLIDNEQMEFDWIDLGSGSYEFESNISDKYSYIKIYDTREYSIKEFDVDVNLRSGSENTIFGVVYNYKDRYNYSYLILNKNGYAGFDLIQNGKHTWNAMSIGECPGVRKGLGKQNRIKLRYDGCCYMKIYINDNEYPTYQFGSNNQGRIGFLCGGESSTSVKCDYTVIKITEY